MFRNRVMSLVLVVGMISVPMGYAMSDYDEGLSMQLRRATHAVTMSSDIALRLAEMLFVRHYGQEQTNAQLPLIVSDRVDRWEINGSKENPPGQRVKMIIMKTDGRIVELVAW